MYDHRGEGAKTLLADIIRRAAFDWVLYRSHRRLKERMIASEAYIWLFEEAVGHPDWVERVTEGWSLFSFLAICDALDLNPEEIRGYIRKLTTRDVAAAGRPVTRREHVSVSSDSEIESDGSYLLYAPYSSEASIQDLLQE